jgi:FHS family L-fucose permease-like MFS transporter
VVHAAGAAACVLLAMLVSGTVAMWAILAVGLFNSIMFPTIFTLAIGGLGRHTSQGSGILCTAIVGGALLPLVQGGLADSIGVQHAFIVPVLCYAYIAWYGVKAPALNSR